VGFGQTSTFDVLDRLSNARTRDNVVEILNTCALQIARADSVAVLLRDGEDIRYCCKGGVRPLWRGDLVPLESSVGRWPITQRVPVIIDEIPGDPRIAGDVCPEAPISLLVVFPIRSADPIGALAVCWRDKPAQPPPLDELQLVANAAAIALENARLFGWAENAYRLVKDEATRYSNLVQTINGVVWEADPETLQFTFVSERARELLGFPLEDWTSAGDFWMTHLHPADRIWAPAARLPSSACRETHNLEYRMIHADGRVVWISDYISAIRTGSDTKCLRGVMVDVTEHKALERRLSWQSLYDSLTSLPNREHFIARVEKEIRDLAGNSRHRIAVLLIDLDRFQHLNDSYGREAGDAILKAVARRLLRSADSLEVVARLDGDQFAVLIPDDSGGDRAQTLAARIHRQFALPFQVAGNAVYLSASIGITLATGGPGTAGNVLREAGTAMYRARNGARARTEFFHPSMHEDVLSRLSLESDLRRAVARKELDLHYQPIVEIRTRRVLGYETLLRWRHIRRGLLLPGEFLMAAENAGLMSELGYHTIDKACAALRRWRARSHASGWISVNLSPTQLADPHLPAYMRAILRKHSVEPARLKVEVTEAGIANDADAMLDRLHQLHAMGIGILIDDFGTGSSTFSRLLSAPAETVKIDRSFVRELSDIGSDAPVLRTIISLAHNLKVGLIAEGVENEAQALRLAELGCESAQGYHFARPAPLAEIDLPVAS